MNRIQAGWVAVLLGAVTASAEPVRVAVLDFEEQVGVKADADLGGGINTAALASKGVFALSQKLSGLEHIALIDRRDFISRMAGSGGPQDRPSFLRAAQAVNADVVVRGILQGLSTGKTSVRQGGYAADFTTLTLRVGLEALDTVDGTVVAAVSGAAQEKVRQTENLKTVMGDEEVYAMLEKAVAKAAGELDKALAKRSEQLKARPVVKVYIKTSSDPALVEIDGLLVGTTPIEGLEVTRGDHVLTVGRAGYRDMSKRIVFDRDMKIEVPLLRTELTADEIKDVLNKARVNAIIGDPGITILPL